MFTGACLLLTLLALGTEAQHMHPEEHTRHLPRWVLCTMARDQLPFMLEWIEFNRYIASLSYDWCSRLAACHIATDSPSCLC